MLQRAGPHDVFVGGMFGMFFAGMGCLSISGFLFGEFFRILADRRRAPQNLIQSDSVASQSSDTDSIVENLKVH
jgi:hypothetical protein